MRTAEIRCRVSRRGATSLSALLRYEILRLRGAAAEQKLLHFRHQEGACLRLDRRQPILVDERGLVRHPLRPRVLGNVVVSPLTQLARIRQVVEALCLSFQQYTVNLACHASNLTLFIPGRAQALEQPADGLRQADSRRRFERIPPMSARIAHSRCSRASNPQRM